jgi:predicted nucleic acid-binding protein
VAESAAVDASPLILFAKAGLFELLRAAAARVVVPIPVVHEVNRTAAGDPTPAALAGAPWLTVVDPGPKPQGILDLRIGAGEASVLAWAMAHPGAEAIIDDR